MTLNETINEIKKFMDTLLGREIFGPKRDVFIRIVYELEMQFLEMEKSDKKPELDPRLLEDIVSTLEFLEAVFVEVPITNHLHNFVICYCVLIHNWNNNVACNERVDILTKLLDGIYNYHMTMAYGLETFKRLIQRCQRMENFALPSVELSRHYLESLDREVEKNNDTSK